eukprot:5276566-Pyramimonas_sp.AAC.1
MHGAPSTLCRGPGSRPAPDQHYTETTKPSDTAATQGLNPIERSHHQKMPFLSLNWCPHAGANALGS